MLPDKTNPKYRDKITTEFGTEGILLDLGVGNRKHYKGSVGIDIRDYPDVDIICDATKLIPLPDNSVTQVYSYHTIEHIPQGAYGGLYREIWRVCAPGTKLDWWFPYWTHETSIVPGHVTMLNERIFSGGMFQDLFKTISIDYTYEDEFKDLPQKDKDFARRHYMNSVKEMRIQFSVRK